jgi:hypothetical protein
MHGVAQTATTIASAMAGILIRVNLNPMLGICFSSFAARAGGMRAA